jgi:hypothetical protein
MMRAPLLLAALLALGACDNAGSDLGLPPVAEGGILVAFYLDRDGNGIFTTADTVFTGARVALLLGQGTDTIRTAVSDANGLAIFADVPVGTWRVQVDRAAFGDSIAVVEGDTGTIRLLASNDSIGGGRTVRLGFQEVTPASARLLPAGRRVMLRGRVVAALQFFGDSTSHLVGGGSALRVTGAVHRPGRTGNNLGDSVAVLGTTGQLAGQPVLLGGLVTSLGEGPAPVAVPVTLAEARTAQNGALDAALVQLPQAAIVDTATNGTALDVYLAIGADTVIVRVDDRLQISPLVFAPTRLVTTRGVLIPVGDGTWVVRPRPVANELTVTNPPPPQP